MKAPIWYVSGLWILWMLQFVLFRPGQKKYSDKDFAEFPLGNRSSGARLLGDSPACQKILGPAGIPLADISRCRVRAGRYLARIERRSPPGNTMANESRDQRRPSACHIGPYQIVRHPIYVSMFAMSIMGAILLGRLPWWPIGVALCLAGIEIRIHVEDRLLRDRFGPRFEAWKMKVPAYLPLIR